MAAKTRLICAALALSGVLAAQSGSADAARSAGRADSLSAALEASDTALFGEVVASTGKGSEQRAEVRVLETLRGPALPKRIDVVAGAEALLEGDARLVTMPPGGMCQYKINVMQAGEVDGELIAWIKQAYESAG